MNQKRLRNTLKALQNDRGHRLRPHRWIPIVDLKVYVDDLALNLCRTIRYRSVIWWQALWKPCLYYFSWRHRFVISALALSNLKSRAHMVLLIWLFRNSYADNSKQLCCGTLVAGILSNPLAIKFPILKWQQQLVTRSRSSLPRQSQTFSSRAGPSAWVHSLPLSDSSQSQCFDALLKIGRGCFGSSQGAGGYIGSLSWIPLYTMSISFA